PYTLNNLRNKQSLKYSSRTFGINLDFDNSQTLANIKFDLPSGKSESLRYGDAVALHVKGGGYVRYEERTFGINLGWSSKPVFEWVILGGRKGDVIKPGNPVSLFNTKASDELANFTRTKGVDLGWFRDFDPLPQDWKILGERRDVLASTFYTLRNI